MEEEGSVLQHLLEIESEAAALVDNAQAEADRRLKESEEQNRIRYEQEYRRLAEQLDGERRERLAAVRAEYDAGLDAYRAGLDTTPLHADDFSRLTFALLFGED
jgi:hypothetical protein